MAVVRRVDDAERVEIVLRTQTSDASGSFVARGALWVLAVVDFNGVPAIIVTVFSAEGPPA